MAALLDLTASDWKAENKVRFVAPSTRRLRLLLTPTPTFRDRDFSTDEQDALFKAAREDVRLRLEERLQREEAFERRLGRRLILEALEHKPLWVTGMDPSNVHLVQREHGALHTRFLELRLEESRIEMIREGGIEVEALTESVGPNPVFDGIKRVEIVVSGGDWHVTETGGSLKILGEGVKADLRVSDWVKQGETLRVRLAS